MPSLKDQLNVILREVLPHSAADAINGTQLIERVRPRLDTDYAESSIRQHFSVLAGDLTSPIAKVDQGQGYYLRPEEDQTAEDSETAQEERQASAPTADAPDELTGRAGQREEKFRALFFRWSELRNLFPMHIEHTRSARLAAGINKWKFPDLVQVRWEVGEVTDRGYRLARDLLEVKRSLGEQPFHLTSVELKVELTASQLRQAFFQCVSNSKWAHAAQLAIACRLSDEKVAEELRRLGASYDVSVVSFGLDTDFLDALPRSDAILDLGAAEFEQYAGQISLTRLAQGREREGLDWEHLRDLRTQNPDMNDLFAWMAYCLEKKAPYSVSDWRNVAKVEANYS